MKNFSEKHGFLALRSASKVIRLLFMHFSCLQKLNKLPNLPNWFIIRSSSNRFENYNKITHKCNPTTDNELQQIKVAWPELPEHIKAAIKALIQTTIQGIQK